MPRKARVPGYLFHRASGQARVVINGVTHYLGPFDSTESKAKYRELIHSLQLMSIAGNFPEIVDGG